MATNYEVVQAQRDFADARNNELRAILNYRKALVNFETVQTVGTRGVGAAIAGGGATTAPTAARRPAVQRRRPATAASRRSSAPRSGHVRHSALHVFERTAPGHCTRSGQTDT